MTLGDGTTKNLLTQVTDPSGRSLNFTWQNLGTQQQPAYRITTIQGPLYSVNYGYNSDLNLSSVTLDPTGVNRTTTYGYTTYTGANGTETGLLASISDPLNHTVSYSYTLWPATSTLFCTTITEPSSGANLVWTISPSYPSQTSGFSNNAGLEFFYSFDSYLRLTLFYFANSSPYTFTYDTANNVTQSGQSPGTAGYPWSTSDMGAPYVNIWNKQVTATYGPHGNVLTQTVLGTNQTTTTTYYDASQYFQKASVTDPLGRVTSFGVGNNTDSNPGNRGSILYVRDAKYSQTGKQFSYTFNAYGQKTSETNLNDVITNYTYGDAWGNLTQVVQDPGTGHLNRTTTMAYDVGGRVMSSTDPMNRTSYFQYNNVGQPTVATFPDPGAETVSYSYGANGRLSTVTDNRGTTTLAYENGNDRVSSVTDPVTGAVGYTYGGNGERLTMSLPGGGTWNYHYKDYDANYKYPILPKDDANAVAPMLDKITDDQGRIVNYRMDITGTLRQAFWNQVFDGTGALTSYCYTFYGFNTYGEKWLTNITNKFYHPVNGSWTGSVLTQNDYTYNSGNMRLTNAISNSGGLQRTENYGYDELYRLSSVNYGDGQTQTYAFDNMSNRSQKTDSVNGNESYSYNAANMLLTRGANNYTNDFNGNTLTGSGRTNTWDSQNRLTQSSYNGNSTQFTYASDGLRHRTVSAGITRDSVLDSSTLVRERSGGGNLATHLVGARGPEYMRDDTSGTVRWYSYDGLGSVLAEVDPSGNTVASRTYDVFGSLHTSAGTGTSKNKFCGSLGHPSEDETGLIYMRARHMDPVTGRFASEDPSGDGQNWFIYGMDNPVNAVDSTGRVAAWLVAALVGGAFGIGAYIGAQLASGKPITGAGLAAAFVGGFIGALCMFATLVFSLNFMLSIAIRTAIMAFLNEGCGISATAFLMGAGGVSGFGAGAATSGVLSLAERVGAIFYGHVIRLSIWMGFLDD